MNKINGHLPLALKLLTAAVAYGILLGQVWQIDQRLARVEAVLLGNALPRAQSFAPPTEAAERTTQ